MLDEARAAATCDAVAQEKVAIVLFNLGGPDRPEAIRPFLMNLFRDPAILRVPFFIRPLLARLIASRRVQPATENYAILGGKSPLLELTQMQARSLEAALSRSDGRLWWRCFIAMRYWHPFSAEAVQELKQFAPDRVVLLPLYPQFSTTTTGSSLAEWRVAAARCGLVSRVTTLCCWYADANYVQATAALVRRAYQAARAALPPEVALRVLFSAHGLPEVIVKAGDPYQMQVEATSQAVVDSLGIAGLDWVVCYQSRATPQQWLTPSTETEIERAAHDKVALLVVPIAFVSEHSETLVELDVEYRQLAEQLGVPGYYRAPAQNDDHGFIAALAALVRRAIADGESGLCSASGRGVCPAAHRDCPFLRSGRA
jgi:ferrochelatase